MCLTKQVKITCEIFLSVLIAENTKGWQQNTCPRTYISAMCNVAQAGRRTKAGCYPISRTRRPSHRPQTRFCLGSQNQAVSHTPPRTTFQNVRFHPLTKQPVLDMHVLHSVPLLLWGMIPPLCVNHTTALPYCHCPPFANTQAIPCKLAANRDTCPRIQRFQQKRPFFASNIRLCPVVGLNRYRYRCWRRHEHEHEHEQAERVLLLDRRHGLGGHRVPVHGPLGADPEPGRSGGRRREGQARLASPPVPPFISFRRA